MANGWGGARQNSGPKRQVATPKIEQYMKEAEAIYGKDRAMHPLQFSFLEMNNPKNDLMLRLRIAKTLMPYCAHRLMAVDVSGQDENRLVIELQDFRRQDQVMVSNLTPNQLTDGKEEGGIVEITRHMPTLELLEIPNESAD